ncbi:YchJ family protein [Desulfosediminicola flagellatus]|uniref:YchJ family protein n=1 Tax=Desulfosediminicola flagellatus TaxID=2569541 RepID=UPI0010AB9518|nr:YchJ family metal-binding protein [Desulfosediminicola flagellatus]
MTIKTAPCFCCSEKPFSECCEPVLQDHSKALTPHTLMRSRYTAYILENEPYLLTTWDPSTRPKKLSLDENPVKWLKLSVHSYSDVDEKSKTGEVKFSAQFLDKDHLCTMVETSRFVRHGALWYYLDGLNEINREKLARNGNCPCGSGKKFKRCCLIK